MIKNTAVFYFSGTGNTEVITQELAEGFKNKKIKADLFPVENFEPLKFQAKKYDLVGFGYPVYGFSTPGILMAFVKKLRLLPDQKVFIFSTCAGPVYLNTIAATRLKNLLKKKKAEVVYERQFYMPPNMLIPTPEDFSKQLYNTAVKKIKKMVQELLTGNIRLVRPGLLGRLINLTTGMMDFFCIFTARDYHVRPACNFCGVCIKLCPVKNIYIKNRKIKFGWRCQSCFRCVYRCPRKAITAFFFKWAILKNGYDLQPVIKNKKLKGQFIKPQTRGYYKIFHDYIFRQD